MNKNEQIVNLVEQAAEQLLLLLNKIAILAAEQAAAEAEATIDKLL
jgi:CDP-diacylglycerol pyrophosphatase